MTLSHHVENDSGHVSDHNEIADHVNSSTNVHGITNTDLVIVEGDSRLTNNRTPTAHASTHVSGGSDPIDLTGIADPVGTAAALVDDLSGVSNASQARTNLGLGNVALQNKNAIDITGGTITGITDLAVADGGTGASTASAARSNLGLGGLAILSTVSTSEITDGTIVNGDISGTAAIAASKISGTALVASNNLSDVTAATARTNLGLDTMATQAASAVAITGGTIRGVTQVRVNESTAQLSSSAIEANGTIHAINGTIGLSFIATEFNGVPGCLDLRSTRGTDLATLSHSLANDILGIIHIGGSRDSSLIDVVSLQFEASEVYGGAAGGASGSRITGYLTANGTDGATSQYATFRFDQDGTAQFYKGLVVGNNIGTAPVTQLDLYAFAASPTIAGLHSAGSRGSPAQTALNNSLLTLAARGYESTTPGYTGSVARIVAAANEGSGFTSANQGTYWRFFANPVSSTTNSEIMRLVGTNAVAELAGPLSLNVGTSFAGPTPATGTALDIFSGLVANRRQAITLVNGANSNLTLPTSSFVVFSGPTGVFNLTGIAGGVDGAEIQFVYLGSQNMTITNEATSTAANRITTLTGADVASTGACAGRLRYDTGTSRWILVQFQA